MINQTLFPESHAIWGTQRSLKIRNAYEGKTTLKGVTMLLVDIDELPLYLQRLISSS
jgi:hypothetical protein